MIRVYDGSIDVLVEKPDDMSNEDFDKFIDEQYLEIEDSVDLSTDIQEELTKPNAPLHGFNVRVVIKP